MKPTISLNKTIRKGKKGSRESTQTVSHSYASQYFHQKITALKMKGKK